MDDFLRPDRGLEKYDYKESNFVSIKSDINNCIK